ncbi:immunity 49 family protein [Burkholderia pseudomallei]|uniref:immunity 49 family protein n=1 Tax=Burkholderia pseudomallei TaxID=28450 RepID=UPI001AD651C9|nr:immunity 49 family protein [Burkholderia pseudomallei]MBO7776115.1 immunity 49 family protein [Burkholderia pseudomallei]MBO7909138.1 immunity 49 family protein [Burkholderia pseudomallei]
MDAKEIERKTLGFDAAMRHIPEVASKIRNRVKPINLKRCYDGLARDHIVVGFYDYFVNGNLSSLKKNLYVSCVIELVSLGVSDDGFELQTPDYLLYSMLSDSDAMVQEFSAASPQGFVSAREDPLNNKFYVHMLQLAMAGDDDSLSDKIRRMAKNGRKPLRSQCERGEDFFSTLIRGDKEGLEKIICADASRESEHVYTEDYFSFVAVLEAKLCWRRGIHVEIDHPLVPMELMPVKPLDHYDDVYDFLKPGWVPPPQGLIDRVSRWFKT